MGSILWRHDSCTIGFCVSAADTWKPNTEHTSLNFRWPDLEFGCLITQDRKVVGDFGWCHCDQEPERSRFISFLGRNAGNGFEMPKSRISKFCFLVQSPRGGVVSLCVVSRGQKILFFTENISENLIMRG